MPEVYAKHRPPSFFQTNTMALHHTLWLGQIMPESSISHKCIWASSTNGRGICLNHSLKGVSSVTLITCLVEWVQPSSLGSSEKMSWYLAKRDWASATNSSGQDSNLLRSNSSNSFSCHCFTVNLGVWWPQSFSGTSIKLVCIESSGTWVTMTALATRVFFLKVWGYVVLFLTTTAMFYCHCATLYLCIDILHYQALR